MRSSKPILLVKDESDELDTFTLSVAGYMSKPGDYKRFVETIRMIDLCWTLSELPSGD